jgi:hypothetical protein
MKVYVLTFVCLDHAELVIRTSTEGVHPDLDFFTKQITNKSEDFDSGYYNYAVIEEVEVGFLAQVKKSYWFKYEPETENIFRTLPPKKIINEKVTFWNG